MECHPVFFFLRYEPDGYAEVFMELKYLY